MRWVVRPERHCVWGAAGRCERARGQAQGLPGEPHGQAQMKPRSSLPTERRLERRDKAGDKQLST